MEKIIWTDRVKIQSAKEERIILETIKRRKANWTGHILRRSCLLKHAIAEKLR
jgi:hypothetical protein